MSDFEFVDPATGLALAAHGFGTVAAGTSSTPKAVRLRYKHGQTGSGAPANALVMRVSENGGSTWRDAVTEFTLAVTAVSAPDVLFTERIRSLGRGTRWPLAPFRAGCYADLTVTFTPDKRTGAASTPLNWELGIDESQAVPAAFVPDAPAGVLSGIGRDDVSEWITAPTLANGTDKTTMGTCDWVHAGIRYTLAGGDVALSQDDSAAAALASGEEYVAVQSVGAGVRTVTKGAKATAGTAVTPAIPAGDLPEATVRVPYGGVIVTSTLHALSGRCAVSDAGGLVVNVQPGRVSVPGWFATPNAVQQITVTDGATAATGSITCVAKASLSDGETVTVAGKVYEFDVAGDGVGGGTIAVDISAVATAAEVANELALAIYDEGDCGINSLVDEVIGLGHLTTGVAGNVTISDTVADVGFLVSGFTGGADGSVTVRLGATGAPSLTDGAALATVVTAAGDILSVDVDNTRRLLGLEEVRLRQAGDETAGTAVDRLYLPYAWAVDSGEVRVRTASTGATGSTDVAVELDGTTFGSGSIAAQGTSAALTFTAFSGAAGWLTLDVAAITSGGTRAADLEVVLWIARR